MPWFLGLMALLSTASVVDDASEPESPATRFAEANRAYDAGRYSDAIAGYEALIKLGFDTGWLDYNLGNSYLRVGELGNAIAHFRRAIGDLPRNGDVRANLAFARQRTLDAITPPDVAPWQHTLFFWHYALSWRELAWGTGLVNALVWGLFIAMRLKPQMEALRWGFWLSFVMLVATAGSLAVRTLAPTTLAVVTQNEINVHSGTDRDTVVRFKLHDGTEMRLLDTQDNWARVELTDGKQGWVAINDIATVVL